ncbi:36.4 kDa proline-rich protein-like [Triticum urartu]|uniref:36.4 kDa proline-rich protein-like n=1 Tax=Triticum urartu TaxID=4572 RepID=UPI0020448C8A|nr:36.4 kDa proline-rich protein-like [Triticum urartu]
MRGPRPRLFPLVQSAGSRRKRHRLPSAVGAAAYPPSSASPLASAATPDPPLPRLERLPRAAVPHPSSVVAPRSRSSPTTPPPHLRRCFLPRPPPHWTPSTAPQALLWISRPHSSRAVGPGSRRSCTATPPQELRRQVKSGDLCNDNKRVCEALHIKYFLEEHCIAKFAFKIVNSA